MDAFEFDEVLGTLPAGQDAFRHFFAAERLSLTAVRWVAGTVDDQTPHEQDEVYLVVHGRAALTVADETTPVHTGSVVYVPAGVEHRFHDIAEDLEVLVFWAPPRVPPPADDGAARGG